MSDTSDETRRILALRDQTLASLEGVGLPLAVCAMQYVVASLLAASGRTPRVCVAQFAAMLSHTFADPEGLVVPIASPRN